MYLLVNGIEYDTSSATQKKKKKKKKSLSGDILVTEFNSISI